MDIIEEVELRDNDQLPECELQLCNGTGSYPVAVGPEDYEHRLCDCPIGQRLAAKDADQYDPEYPLSSMVRGWADQFRSVCEQNGFIGGQAI